MKKLLTLFVLLTVLACTATALANAKPIIRADDTYYDADTGLYVLKGNCYLEIANRVITCNEAKVSMGSLEIWGYGGIRLTQGDITFTGNSAYIYGRRNSAEIDGGVTFSRTGFTVTADKAEFNWRSKIGSFSGNVRVNQNGNQWTTDSLQYNVETNTIL